MTKLITDTTATVTPTYPCSSRRVLAEDGKTPRTRSNRLSTAELTPQLNDLGDGGYIQPPSATSSDVDGAGRLVIVPIALRTARAFIAWSHRHLLPPRGAKFAIGVSTEDGTLVGVVTAGRPVSRVFDDGLTIEVTRLATDGTPNACSALLGAAWRAAKAMGYRRPITYTRIDEPGTSPRAAGLSRVPDRAPRQGWNTPNRPSASRGADGVTRVLWEITTDTPGRCGAAK
ncbi:XF1762 family protein [Nonomuraea sp. B19D2]|uniref:XF1762 family protein n=1 Tax=Nonomuraea sp. B19D2 TaxID=3159561 RepID=UPI0032DA2CCA